jgi:Cysteine-rich secretory protein family
MYVILVIALVWSIVAGFALALLRAAAQGDRATERQARERRARRGAEARRHSGRVALVVVALPLIGVNPPDASASGCAGADSPPARSGPAVTLCLINAERRVRGLPALAANGRLARAARGHAADMVARGYFAHTSPGGITFAARLRQVGYMARCAWPAGETLAWGAGEHGTPASRVAAWSTAARTARSCSRRASARRASASSPERPAAAVPPSPTRRRSDADAAERVRS